MAGWSRPALFLDRDGTIIEDRHYLGDPTEVVLLAGAAAGISRFNRAGWPVIIVTNQSGIGRGIIGADQYEAVNDRMIDLLGVQNAEITAVYHCPHDPLDEPGCECRKPARGLFVRAAKEHRIDLASSHFVGDRLRDVEPSIAFGGSGYLMRHSEGPEDREERVSSNAIRVVDSIQDVADLVLGPEK